MSGGDAAAGGVAVNCAPMPHILGPPPLATSRSGSDGLRVQPGQLVGGDLTNSGKELLLKQLHREVQSSNARVDAANEDRRRSLEASRNIKGSIRILGRVRPPLSHEVDDTDCLRVQSKSQLEVLIAPRALLSDPPVRLSAANNNLHPVNSGGGIASKRRSSTGGIGVRECTERHALSGSTLPESDILEPRTYMFDDLFGSEADDDDIFSAVREELAAAVEGEAVCILAYGATGSGKTHTVTNLSERAAKELERQAISLSEGGLTLEITVQIVEIYNQQLRDLLSTNEGGRSERPSLKLSVSDSNATLIGANCRTITYGSDGSMAEALQEALRLGQSLRATSATAVHGRSSRSHLVMTLFLTTRHKATRMILKSGKLSLVDLAGSERIKRSEAVGDRLKEAQHINRSLSALADVISAKERRVAHVPYRNSKLTHLLQDALGGQERCRTVVIVALPPTRRDINDTLHSLQFSARLTALSLPTVVSRRSLPGLHLPGQRPADRAAEEEKQKLRQELARLKDEFDRAQAQLDGFRQEIKQKDHQLEEAEKRNAELIASTQNFERSRSQLAQGFAALSKRLQEVEATTCTGGSSCGGSLEVLDAGPVETGASSARTQASVKVASFGGLSNTNLQSTNGSDSGLRDSDVADGARSGAGSPMKVHSKATGAASPRPEASSKIPTWGTSQPSSPAGKPRTTHVTSSSTSSSRGNMGASATAPPGPPVGPGHHSTTSPTSPTSPRFSKGPTSPKGAARQGRRASGQASGTAPAAASPSIHHNIPSTVDAAAAAASAAAAAAAAATAIAATTVGAAVPPPPLSHRQQPQQPQRQPPRQQQLPQNTTQEASSPQRLPPEEHSKVQYYALSPNVGDNSEVQESWAASHDEANEVHSKLMMASFEAGDTDSAVSPHAKKRSPREVSPSSRVSERSPDRGPVGNAEGRWCFDPDALQDGMQARDTVSPERMSRSRSQSRRRREYVLEAISVRQARDLAAEAHKILARIGNRHSPGAFSHEVPRQTGPDILGKKAFLLRPEEDDECEGEDDFDAESGVSSISVSSDEGAIRERLRQVLLTRQAPERPGSDPDPRGASATAAAGGSKGQSGQGQSTRQGSPPLTARTSPTTTKRPSPVGAGMIRVPVPAAVSSPPAVPRTVIPLRNLKKSASTSPPPSHRAIRRPQAPPSASASAAAPAGGPKNQWFSNPSTYTRTGSAEIPGTARGTASTSPQARRGNPTFASPPRSRGQAQAPAQAASATASGASAGPALSGSRSGPPPGRRRSPVAERQSVRAYSPQNQRPTGSTSVNRQFAPVLSSRNLSGAQVR
eukprot:CAMPEP_0206541874 /NCGR_PEP_ID=MMETSP0325_2-20121206/9858_1 /ASSEMBLY_ACC=CAM_ASM_000347 /TAXON_ID=2866 /ORGANISM="Crypthecodinium cohnii, Strain Seligo" /LENGTH=1313 /DNA_ID=CAMNT_0054039867 /DNA_START=63 /DNA_END=4004 /DNA_ORIENTATION=+